jgi:hypothetical protein
MCVETDDPELLGQQPKKYIMITRANNKQVRPQINGVVVACFFFLFFFQQIQMG